MGRSSKGRFVASVPDEATILCNTSRMLMIEKSGHPAATSHLWDFRKTHPEICPEFPYYRLIKPENAIAIERLLYASDTVFSTLRSLTSSYLSCLPRYRVECRRPCEYNGASTYLNGEVWPARWQPDPDRRPLGSTAARPRLDEKDHLKRFPKNFHFA